MVALLKNMLILMTLLSVSKAVSDAHKKEDAEHKEAIDVKMFNHVKSWFTHYLHKEKEEKKEKIDETASTNYKLM